VTGILRICAEGAINMKTLFAVSTDGTRIAYDISGAGEPIVLLHGGLHTRQHWHNAGYVERLKNDFKVIAIDIRGNGESDKHLDPAYYTTKKHCEDILAVAAECGLERFTVWGYSYGANIGRYLAAKSDLVDKFVLLGYSFGPGASGTFRQFIPDFCDRWVPILKAQADKTLDVQTLSGKDQAFLKSGEVPVILAWLIPILDWAPVEPADLLCPTLWLAGSKNDDVMANMKEYEANIEATNVKMQIMDGLDHWHEFTEIDRVLSFVVPFIKS